jgi:AcrR family transcriptional regulator
VTATRGSRPGDGQEDVEDAHAPKQERSRRTLDRLLTAAEAVLAERGLDGATVPAIAERAGLSVGAVYRRFPDKEALMRAVYERFFEHAMMHNRESLDPARWREVPVADVVASVVRGVVEGYRRNRGILRALHQYKLASRDPAFRRRMEELNAAALAQIQAVLLPRHAEFAHPDASAAIGYGLAFVTFVVRAVFVEESTELVTSFLPPPDMLAAELTRAYLGYLGVELAG